MASRSESGSYNGSAMPRRKWTGSEFGRRLVALRKERNLTQVELAAIIGSTHRAISYYENEASYPPAPVVALLAKALEVTTDELLGVKRTRSRKQQDDPEARRLWRKFLKVMTLPEKDQRAVIRLINSLVTARGNGRR